MNEIAKPRILPNGANVLYALGKWANARVYFGTLEEARKWVATVEHDIGDAKVYIHKTKDLPFAHMETVKKHKCVPPHSTFVAIAVKPENASAVFLATGSYNVEPNYSPAMRHNRQMN